MKMPDALAQAMNAQVTMELESSIAYLQMAAHLEAQSLTGMGAWMRMQAAEEHTHAMRFFDHILDRGNEVSIGTIQAPAGMSGGPVDVFEASLAQEQKVSASITDIYKIAIAEGDGASLSMLQWFLEEQVEEEATVSEIIDRLRLAGSDGSALLQLDRELGARQPEGDE